MDMPVPCPETPSRWKRMYVFLYNLFQFVGYFYIASALLFDCVTVNMAYGIVMTSLPLFLVQFVACLEIIHSMFGIVKSSVSSPLARVAGRNVIIVVVILLVLTLRHDSKVLSPLHLPVWCLVLVWSITEVIKYLFYILRSLGLAVKPVTWLRYSAWIILCPLELLLEGIVVIMSAVLFKNSWEYSVSDIIYGLTWFLHVYVFVLALAGYKMVKYMHKKRKEKLDITGQDEKKTL